MNSRIDYTVRQIAEIVAGEWLCFSREMALEFICLDSRRISNVATSIFWALPGQTRRGSDYIDQLYASGVRNFVTSDRIDTEDLADANIIFVSDSLSALQSLATYHRSRFKNIHVFGITGSNGKTVVKEWLSEILSTHAPVVKSPGSYNSQIGVALSVLQIREHHRFGIFEAGISQPHEMQRLQKMILPHTGIFTNIGPAHDEGFTGREEKLREKLLLFSGVRTLVFPGEAGIRKSISETAHLSDAELIDWCRNGCSITLQETERMPHGSMIHVQSPAGRLRLPIPFSDDASISNTMSVLGALLASKAFRPADLELFASLHPVAMRMQLEAGVNGSVVINDSYSSDLQSLSIALDFLKQQRKSRFTVILSDVQQSGLRPDELYAQIAALLGGKKIDRLIGIGEHLLSSQKHFHDIAEQYFFATTDEFLTQADRFDFIDEAVLIKGARSFSFERISRRIESKAHHTRLTVNLSNLNHNVTQYRSQLRQGVRLMAMVKAFAYGTGSEQISSLLQSINADYLAVAFADEAILIREAGIGLPVMIMNVDGAAFDKVVRYRLEPEIFSFSLLRSFSHFLSAQGINDFPVHIKIDTGMHRLGFEEQDLPHLAEELRRNKHIRVQSAFTHFAAAGDPAHDAFTRKQADTFKRATAHLSDALNYSFLRHTSNTAAITRFPDYQFDMARLGIGMYGIDDNPHFAERLKPVAHLTTSISQIKQIPSGDSVGYGFHPLQQDATIATVGIGYADGYLRSLGHGRGSMMIRGQLAPTIGSICMDMTMLDITKIADAREGDEVVVFDERLPITDVARWAGTIPYEILSGLSSRLKRVYVREE